MAARRSVAAAALATAGAADLAAAQAQAADFGRHDRALGAHVRISQVRYVSPGRDDPSNRSLNAEWVRLTNGPSRPAPLVHHRGAAPTRVRAGVGAWKPSREADPV